MADRLTAMTTDVVDEAHQRFIGAREAFSWPPSFAGSSEWSADRASGAFSDGDRVMPKRIWAMAERLSSLDPGT